MTWRLCLSLHKLGGRRSVGDAEAGNAIPKLIVMPLKVPEDGALRGPMVGLEGGCRKNWI